MKKLPLIIVILLVTTVLTACKKSSTPTKITRVTNISYTLTGSPALSKAYAFTYNAAGKITRIDLTGGASITPYYYLFYYSTHLDSVTRIRTSGGSFDSKAVVQWTGDHISFSWMHHYTYDSSGRLNTMTYPYPTGVYRVVYSSDSIKFYRTPAGSAEYYEDSYTFLQNFKNPYLIANNEKEANALNFALDPLYSDFYMASPYVMNYLRYYNPDGSLNAEIHFTPEGNTDGYPNKITISSVVIPTIVLEFTYEQI